MRKNLFLGLTILTGLVMSPLAHAKEKEVVVVTAGDIRPFSF